MVKLGPKDRVTLAVTLLMFMEKNRNRRPYSLGVLADFAKNSENFGCLFVGLKDQPTICFVVEHIPISAQDSRKLWGCGLLWFVGVHPFVKSARNFIISWSTSCVPGNFMQKSLRGGRGRGGLIVCEMPLLY